jgi:methylated-DNA-protein-cysteine methyltransferase-like protein
MNENEPGLNQRIWQVVAAIPPGRVATYGDIARHAGLPGAARRVGRALRQLPAGTRLPWHRVVNASGKLSLPADSPGEYTQRTRLEAEGVVFSANKKIDLASFRWNPSRDD